MSEWNLPQTAPKDGTPVLLCYRLRGGVGIKTWSRVGEYGIRPARWRRSYNTNSGVMTEDWRFEVSGFIVDRSAIVGWMPLPAPPEPKP